jgi:DNA transposition AAA+ family ATPase
MKKVFVKTQNVKKLIAMMNNLQNRAEGVPGMGLVYGEPGLGKTHSVVWWATQNDAIFVRCTNMMSARWLLEEIVEELGEMPFSKFSDIFNQVISQLIKEPRIIIVDEIDYLTVDTKAIETLRDIHDKTDVPILLVGMGNSNRRLMRYKHLYDRVSEILRFEPFSKKDITQIIDTLSEVEMTECAKSLLYSKTNRFRQIVKLINKAEQVAKSNGINSIDETTLKEFINDEVANQDSELNLDYSEDSQRA